MRRKEINIFNISFLDLLSGALGAVIILFIAVPKNKAPESSSKVEQATCSVEKKLLNQCLDELDTKKQNIQEGLKSKEELERKVIALTEENKKIKEELKKSAPKTEEIKKDASVKTGNADVGFKFKGKNIVFLIDVSGSMVGEKIGQVKAGLKMLIASMGSEYSVDIVYFPHTLSQDYYSLWGLTQPLATMTVKEEVYDFLAKLRPRGNTPTRSALLYALSNYPDATDIVLLSDGLPTIQGTQQIDNYEDLIKDISWHNGKKVQINAIGVGAISFNGQSSNLYKFLKSLSETSNGFFYGF